MVALTDKYSDAARADLVIWQDDVQTYMREAARGSKLRSYAAVDAGLTPGTPLQLSNSWNRLLSSGFYSGGSRLRSQGAVDEGIKTGQPLAYHNDPNIVSFPYGQPGTSSGLAVATFTFQVYDTGARDQYGNILPLAGATVKITLAFAQGGVPAGTVYTATTDASGLATFTVEEGRFNIEISKPGYITYFNNDAVSFGQGGGFIWALDPAPNDGGGNLGLLAVAAVVVIGGISYFGKRRR